MNIEELFAGVGLVIDDHVFEAGNDKIKDIVADIERRHIPLAKYDYVPQIEAEQCKRMSFLLLDWELVSLENEYGEPIPGVEAAKEAEIGKLINLIATIVDNCYVPVFIFSNTAREDIVKKLEDAEVLIEGKNLPIFIENKSSIVAAERSLLWAKIESWVKQNPSIYVCKVWQNAACNAEINLLQDLSISKNWPKILWEASSLDGVDPSEEMADVLSQNLFARMQPLKFDEEIIANPTIEEPSMDEIKGVLQAQRYTAIIDKEVSMTGDFYKCSGGKFYLNIRPSCDCVARAGSSGKVYLLRADKIKPEELYDPKYGNFKEQSNNAIVGPLHDNGYFMFKFQNLNICDAQDIKDRKIGRVLPPFLTHITEKYGLYIQRQGLPRLPVKAVLADEQIAEGESGKEESV